MLARFAFLVLTMLLPVQQSLRPEDPDRPLYGVRNSAFGRSKLVGGGELVLQEVTVADREGRDWTAIFEVRLMDDRVYKINGIRLLRNSSSRGI